MALYNYVRKDSPKDYLVDPREDLTEDSELWVRFLTLAVEKYSHNDLIYGLLHGFRCGGTKIIKNSKGNYVLRPLIDKTLGWESEQKYKEARDRWLQPYAKELTSLLALL